MKICNKCVIEKLLIEFYKSKTGKDGLRSECKDCIKQYQIKNADKIRTRHKEYLIKNADKIRQQSILYMEQWKIDNPEYSKQYRIDNLDKITLYQTQYRIDNPDYFKQYNKQYFQTPQGKLIRKVSDHKRRVSLRDNTVGKHFTPADIIMKFKLQKGECIYCEISIKDGYHIDHFIPVSKGGSNEAWNIQLLCAKCNRAKWDNPAYEFAQNHGKLI